MRTVATNTNWAATDTSVTVAFSMKAIVFPYVKCGTSRPARSLCLRVQPFSIAKIDIISCKNCICFDAVEAFTAREEVLVAKQRTDQLLVERGLAESRARAQALILAGLVFSGEQKIGKAGQALAEDAPLEVRGREHPWVSRGGIKLAHALDHFGWDVKGAVALDVGSSTGGFTDVLLQRGAAKVFAIDVGTHQLASKLRQDPRLAVR